eukprot:5724287-Amphidinium_carterae.1
MQRAMVVRREKLNEHIASVPASLMTGVRQAHRTRQWQKSHEEGTEIATLTAKLGCAESNMFDLERFAELEHNTAKSILAEGRQFYVHVEQQARGFSQAESDAARSNAELERRRYRQADVVRQGQLLANLESRMEQANREALNQHKLAVGERYRTEFEAELSSVKHQVEMLQQAHKDNNVVTALQDEILVERQRSSLEGQRLQEMIA